MAHLHPPWPSVQHSEAPAADRGGASQPEVTQWVSWPLSAIETPSEPSSSPSQQLARESTMPRCAAHPLARPYAGICSLSEQGRTRRGQRDARAFCFFSMLARESRRGGAGVAGVMPPRCRGAGRAAAGCGVPMAGAPTVSAGTRVSVRRPCSKAQRTSAHHQTVASCRLLLTTAQWTCDEQQSAERHFRHVQFCQPMVVPWQP